MKENNTKICVTRRRWSEIFNFLIENDRIIPELLCTMLEQDMVQAEVLLLNAPDGKLTLFPRIARKCDIPSAAVAMGLYRPSPYNPSLIADSIMKTSIIDIVAGIVNQLEVREA